MAQMSSIVVERSGRRGSITLARPEARNGITGEMLTDLLGALRAMRSEDLSILVLRGAGDDFSVGADLRVLQEGGKAPSPETFEISAILHEMPAVTIAALRGACAGAALAWSCACDLRYAAKSTRLSTAFIGVGLPGDMGGAWTLSRIVGAAKARELFYLGARFSADDALRMGFVSQVWEDAVFDETLERVVAQLESAAPLALRAMKANFVDSERFGLLDFIDRETARHVAVAKSDDTREAFAAFLEKRAPRFRGQ